MSGVKIDRSSIPALVMDFVSHKFAGTADDLAKSHSLKVSKNLQTASTKTVKLLPDCHQHCPLHSPSSTRIHWQKKF